MKNELLEEVWRIRDKISTECGHNIKRLAARMKRLELEYADRLARLPIRRRSEPEATDALREEPPPYGRKPGQTK
jgi:hypothetical protein